MFKCKVIENCRIFYEGEFQNISAGTILEVDAEHFENLEQCGLVEKIPRTSPQTIKEFKAEEFAEERQRGEYIDFNSSDMF
jgi:hypothetical protein